MEIENLLDGHFDEENRQFQLTRIKHLTTNTSLNVKQVSALCSYLEKYVDEDNGQIVSFYDQLLLYLSPKEIIRLRDELKGVLERFF